MLLRPYFTPILVKGLLIFLVSLLFGNLLWQNQARKSPLAWWPKQVRRIWYRSPADASYQPALFYAPRTRRPVPLLVALHTWHGDYMERSSVPYARYAIENDWAFIHPHFRGPNIQPEATGSDLVIADILAAVDYARGRATVDPQRIYLIGASGGGHAALLVAARHPHIWAGVSAWVPVTNLEAWYAETLHTRVPGDLESACGGPPGVSPEVDLEYRRRSPLTYLHPGLSIPIDLNTGIHEDLVPVSHALQAFNLLAAPQDRLPEGEILYFARHALVPPRLVADYSDPAYGERQVLFRRQSGKVRITVFDGGHEILYKTGLNWLAKQVKED